MKESVHGCTSNNVSLCKEMLSLFLPLTEKTTARIIGRVIRTHSSSLDQKVYPTYRDALIGSSSSKISDLTSLVSWKADVLVDAIKQLAPELNWVAVVEYLDHGGFYIPSEEAFSFFMSIYKHACQDPFPLQAICGSIWKNTEGQLSLLKYTVSVPPEVFTFAHSGRQLAYIDAVNEHKVRIRHTNHAWLCLDLLEILCKLAERGHSSSVLSIIEYPLKHCPEVLLLGMSHINVTVDNYLQHEVSSLAFPLILKNAAASGMIQHLWHVNPRMLLRGLVDAAKIDPENMCRFLDACHEQKVLSHILHMTPYSFSIRLAVLASGRKLIDFEKWFSNNLKTYKDAFLEECLEFLKGVHNEASNCSRPPNALWTSNSETSSTFLKVLQSHSGLVSSSHLSKELEKLHTTYNNNNNNHNNNININNNNNNNIPSMSPQVGSGLHTTNMNANSDSVSHSDDIEAESDTYFRLLFSGQLSNEAMIQMLARFKESTDLRELAIFDNILANLFEEYKFFTKYPERQLNIAALLFGSLIKHKLVSHLPLGIALRTVLDALKYPAGSKMFMFGTTALKQYVDRVAEWPTYCIHILNMSHFRATHPDLIANIEEARARCWKIEDLAGNPVQ